MKSQDIVILLKIVSLDEPNRNEPYLLPREEPYSVRGLAYALGISKTEVSASLNRSYRSGLALKDRETGRPKPNRRNLYDFIAHGLKFVFPAEVGNVGRGIPTAFAAPPLAGKLLSAGEYIWVWPYATGKHKGQLVEPLFKSVPEAVQNDMRLYEYLALIDAIRLGNAREAGLASSRLSKGLLKE